jgi:lipopolysaccharide transport system ATP-binding protein
MAEDVVIHAEGLGKKYRIGYAAERERYIALRDVMAGGARNLWRKAADMARGGAVVVGDTIGEFWALRDVSFDVKRGEVLGIIGRNGAGKTTLLKILSRITEPSEGRVTIKGRIASLLEVGTGFHPELTGRENIYLNGAILGMTRTEIHKKFDEIVAFAEVHKFLDTPVKRYSSGMYVRLAFAVAAHLEPEILVVDEVLAVGDAEFQKKCLGKMSQVAGGGRTVLFVSHNMGSIGSLCETAILLRSGRIAHAGSTDKVIQAYTMASTANARIEFPVKPDSPSIMAVSVDQGALCSGDFFVSIEYVSPRPLKKPIGGVVVSTATGVPVWGSNGRFHHSDWDRESACSGILICECVGIPLTAATYTLSAWLGDWHQDLDQKRDVLSFHFRPQWVGPVRPSPSAIGNLDWPARWRFERPTRNAAARNDQRTIPDEYKRWESEL